MTAPGLLALLIAASACWGTPRASPAPAAGDGPVAGTRWITPPQAWRTSERVQAMLVRGRTALVGGRAGWLAEVDLSSGAIVREVAVGPWSLSELLGLPDGRILALGVHDGVAGGAVLDARTLAATPIALGGSKAELTYAGVDARVVAGGVLIAGPGLPLAIYDPATWTRREVISDDEGWSDLGVTGDAIYAKHRFTAARFALADRARDASFSQLVVAVAGDTVVTRKLDGGKLVAFAAVGDAPPVRLRELAYTTALDPAGKRLAELSGETVAVLSLVDGRALGSYDLGPRSRTGAVLAFAGERLVVADDSVIRVIDLASGYVSPRGAPPVGSPRQLAVGDDGEVLALGAEIAVLVDGKPVHARAVSGGVLTNPPGEHRRYAVRTPREVNEAGAPAIAVYTRGSGRRVWRLARRAADGWLGANGEVVAELEYDPDQPGKVVRSRGGTMIDAFAFYGDSVVEDVDVDAGVAAVSLAGTVHFVDVATGKATGITARVPRCADYGATLLERGGARAITSDDRDLAVWDRRTGALVATLRHARDVLAPVFVPGSDEVLLLDDDGLVLWSPRTRELRTARIPHLALADVSAGGRSLVLGFRNGQIAVADFATARAGLAITRAQPSTAVAAACEVKDPLSPSEDDDDHDGDDDDDDGDPDPDLDDEDWEDP